MPAKANDPAYLWDMLSAARQIASFVQGISFTKYSRNKLIQSAVERQLEIIGEAARRVSPEYQEDHPEIPWRPIIGLRNILAHEYGEIKADRIWLIAKNDVPGMAKVLETLVPSD
jgi:uncharacterized protein with HEPN domain